MSIAICDPEAFYPLRDLVEGSFNHISQLCEVEQLVRAVVLHDEIVMELAPLPYDEEIERESEAEGAAGFKINTDQLNHNHPLIIRMDEHEAVGKLRIVSLGPSADEYLVFTKGRAFSSKALENIDLSKALLEHAAKYSNAGPGNVYYETHVHFLKQIAFVERNNGSAVVASKFGVEGLGIAQKYPKELFLTLDNEWQNHAQMIHERGVGFLVPPVLGILLKRCQSREEIPLRLKELRDEWAEARGKVWKLLEVYRNSKKLSEIKEVERELLEASRYFSPNEEIGIKDRAVRIVWDIVEAGSVGYLTGTLAGNPLAGVAIGIVRASGKSTKDNLHEVGKCLFGRGALDLANKVRQGVDNFDPDALSRLLTEAEKQKLGIR